MAAKMAENIGEAKIKEAMASEWRKSAAAKCADPSMANVARRRKA